MANTLSPKKEYCGIDFCKLVAAMLIIVLHAIETDNVYAVGAKYIFTRFCVPFFFICSGFFFCAGLRRARNPEVYFQNYEKRLILLFLFYGVVISTPIVITDYIKNNPDASPLRLILLIIRRIFVIGNGAYWYLVALIISIAFLYICYCKKWDRFLIIAIVIGFVLQIGYTSFQGIIAQISLWNKLNNLFYFIFSWEFNFIMFGIPFCGIGWLLCKQDVIIPKKTAWALFLVFTFLRFLEYVLPYLSVNAYLQNNAFSIAFIPQAVMFFYIAYHSHGIPKYSKSIRQLSTFVYFTHWIILYNVLDPVMLNVFEINIYDPGLVPLKVLITFIACLGLNWMLKKTNNKYIRFLIGG